MFIHNFYTYDYVKTTYFLLSQDVEDRTLKSVTIPDTSLVTVLKLF